MTPASEPDEVSRNARAQSPEILPENDLTIDLQGHTAPEVIVVRGNEFQVWHFDGLLDVELARH